MCQFSNRYYNSEWRNRMTENIRKSNERKNHLSNSGPWGADCNTDHGYGKSTQTLLMCCNDDMINQFSYCEFDNPIQLLWINISYSSKPIFTGRWRCWVKFGKACLPRKDILWQMNCKHTSYSRPRDRLPIHHTNDRAQSYDTPLSLAKIMEG